MKPEDVTEASLALERVLRGLDDGELVASARMRRQMEGALLALRALDAQREHGQ